MQKVFVTSDHKATLTCPECNRSKIIDASPYVKLSGTVKIRVKCPCGYRQPFELERRRHFRKTVNFLGSFSGTTEGRHRDGGRMVVRDLSRAGLKMLLNENSSLRIGDKILVEFQLDDLKGSSIRKESVVRRINGFDLAAEFLPADPSDPNTRALSFYLFA